MSSGNTEYQASETAMRLASIPLSAMSPAITTASTPWLRNHSSVCLKVRLLPNDSIFSSAPTRRMWMSETTPNRSRGVSPALNDGAAIANLLPQNAPNAAVPPMRKLRLDILFIGCCPLPTSSLRIRAQEREVLDLGVLRKLGDEREDSGV